MADVDMTDAPGPSTSKQPADAANKKLDGKKRFEVKKVGWPSNPRASGPGLTSRMFRSRLWPFGPGISSWTTVPFAGTISWIFVSFGDGPK